MAKRGPKNKYDPLEIAEQLNDYIDETNDPQMAEFCLPREMPCRDTMYELAKQCTELSDAIKRLVQKQEVYLVRCGNGNLHPTMCVFRLKQPQHGYTDKQQQEFSGPNGGPIQTANVDLSNLSVKEIERELMKLEQLNAGTKKAKVNTRKTKKDTVK